MNLMVSFSHTWFGHPYTIRSVRPSGPKHTNADVYSLLFPFQKKRMRVAKEAKKKEKPKAYFITLSEA